MAAAIATFLGPAARPIASAGDVAAAPRLGGAYLLILRIGAPVELAIESLGRPRLDRGVYVYAGSALGPGGIGARLARHFRSDKRPHWHIDHLMAVADAVGAVAVPGGGECDLVRRLKASPRSHQPVGSFGSSDCRVCRSHLVALRADGWVAGW